MRANIGADLSVPLLPRVEEDFISSRISCNANAVSNVLSNRTISFFELGACVLPCWMPCRERSAGEGMFKGRFFFHLGKRHGAR